MVAVNLFSHVISCCKVRRKLGSRVRETEVGRTRTGTVERWVKWNNECIKSVVCILTAGPPSTREG
jgi:hypothetical protein